MNIEDIIKAWKADEGTSVTEVPRNPIGEELSDKELLEVVGGVKCIMECSSTGNACANNYTE